LTFSTCIYSRINVFSYVAFSEKQPCIWCLSCIWK
jgi:hypothetical protein